MASNIGVIATPSFTLDSDFILNFVGKQPNWGPVGYITYKRTYARTLENGKTEEWWQTTKRVVEGCISIQKNHCGANYLPWDEDKAQRTAQKMFQKIWDFKFTPPGRGLWSMGTSNITKIGGMALNNCAFVSTNNISTDIEKPFTFAMDCLMLGVGVGFDTVGAKSIEIQAPNSPYDEEDTNFNLYIVPDTREGWVLSVGLVIRSFLFQDIELPKFDYTLVRKAGEPIRGFGGTASGPDPLKELHNSIFNLFKDREGEYLTSSDITDIMNLIGKCVVAGNVRRSAELAIGSPDDKEFIELKNSTKNKTALLSHRWASNNSVSADVGMDYTELSKLTAANGEPGYIWLDNMREYGRMADGARNADPLVTGANPCVEQTLESYELCCLVETFPARHDSLAEYMETLKLAYLYAKTVTLMPTHWPEANTVMLRNRRIGCSQSGITRAFNRHGRRTILNWCNDAYQLICALDKQYSQWLCVPKSRKRTSVKPSGTVSLLCGETPGIHYPIAEHYLRRIRFSSTSSWISKLIEAGYHAEPDVTQPATTTVVEFPIKESYFSRSVSNVSMWEQLETVAQYQHYWADNSISATITFDETEAKSIPKALELYESRLKSISFLPRNNHGYAQAPYEAITETEYYNRIASINKDVLFGEVNEEADGGKQLFCDSSTCEIPLKTE
jgi:adenosylcobalamin-dependent ribonucleoside-triphosphate reductase